MRKIELKDIDMLAVIAASLLSIAVGIVYLAFVK